MGNWYHFDQDVRKKTRVDNNGRSNLVDHFIVRGLTMKEAGQSERETVQPNNQNGSKQPALIAFYAFCLHENGARKHLKLECKVLKKISPSSRENAPSDKGSVLLCRGFTTNLHCQLLVWNDYYAFSVIIRNPFERTTF